MNRIALASLVFCVLCFASGGVWAAAATTGCDPQYMDAMEARGKIELSREHAQNQNFIYKADSVFEYSCFTDDITNLTTVFPNSGSVANTTTTPTSNFVTANFSHTYLGGRVAVDPAVVAGTCNVMASVWQFAHCINFFDRPDQDGFFDFRWYTNNDPRTLPQACGSPPVKNNDITIAYNGKEATYVPPAENPNDATPYLTDNIVPHDFGDNCDESPMIPTGIVIKRPGFTPNSYNEKVCPYPGCYYYPTDVDAGECRNTP